MNTSLSTIKTPDKLFILLASEGWRKSPTREPLKVTDNGFIFPGNSPLEPPCWETSCEAVNQQWGIKEIKLHPGLGEDHGDVYAVCEVRDGLVQGWVMGECHAGSTFEIDAENTDLGELRKLLKDWVASWGV